jgi:predicted lipoprotein with Yx(FWY)xxD motif
VIPLVALTVAACGGGGAATAATPKTSSGASATVGVSKSSLGSILVDSKGHTLYLFKGDSGTSSACSGACATAWPPLLSTGKPTAGTGLTASKLGTITRSDGNHQVTYNGHPLYTFVKDTKPGQTNGQGVTAFGAAWFAVSPAGNQIGGRASSGGSSPSPAAQPPATTTAPAPPATTPAPPPATTPAPPPPATNPAPPPPAAKPAPPANSGIPQNGGGDGDADNSGGPSDGDGNV